MNDDLFDSNKPAKYMGADLEYVFRQLCEAREIIATMIFEYESRKGHSYSTVMKGKELLRKGVFSENLSNSWVRKPLPLGRG